MTREEALALDRQAAEELPAMLAEADEAIRGTRLYNVRLNAHPEAVGTRAAHLLWATREALRWVTYAQGDAMYRYGSDSHVELLQDLLREIHSLMAGIKRAAKPERPAEDPAQAMRQAMLLAYAETDSCSPEDHQAIMEAL